MGSAAKTLTINNEIEQLTHEVNIKLNKLYPGHQWQLIEIRRAILRMAPVKIIDINNPEHIESLIGVMNAHRILVRSLERLKMN